MDDKLAQNLVAIWQSELTALAADREARENWVMLIRLWAQAANATMALQKHDTTPGSPLAPQPPRPSPAHAASGARLDEVDALNQRVAELERRLAALLEQQGLPPAGTGEPRF